MHASCIHLTYIHLLSIHPFTTQTSISNAFVIRPYIHPWGMHPSTTHPHLHRPCIHPPFIHSFIQRPRIDPSIYVIHASSMSSINNLYGIIMITLPAFTFVDTVCVTHTPVFALCFLPPLPHTPLPSSLTFSLYFKCHREIKYNLLIVQCSLIPLYIPLTFRFHSPHRANLQSRSIEPTLSCLLYCTDQSRILTQNSK